MTINLDSLPRKLAVIGALALTSAALTLPISAHYRAAAAAEPGTQAGLEQAIALQPRNAELHNRLGRVLLYTPLADAARTQRELELATQLNPRSGQFWLDLAMFHEGRGNLTAAGAALERAVKAEPLTPAVQWFEANYLVRRGDSARGLERLKTLLAGAPEYTVRALAFFSRVAEPSELIETALPRRRESLDAALEFIRTEQILSAAPALWRTLQSLTEPPSESQLRLFLDWLISRQETTLAQQVWQESARRGWLPIADAASTASFYNGNFEYPLQNFGFDWRVIPHPEASAWVESRGPSAGMQSLCIQFSDDARSLYHHLLHAIAVEPNTAYSLKAAMRSERLLSRAGASITLATAENQVVAQTAPITGSNQWTEVAANVVTDAKTTLLHLRLVRPAPPKNEDPASGLACVADVRWTQLGKVPNGGASR